jgi:hypothetical protein
MQKLLELNANVKIDSRGPFDDGYGNMDWEYRPSSLIFSPLHAFAEGNSPTRVHSLSMVDIMKGFGLFLDVDCDINDWMAKEKLHFIMPYRLNRPHTIHAIQISSIF